MAHPGEVLPVPSLRLPVINLLVAAVVVLTLLAAWGTHHVEQREIRSEQVHANRLLIDVVRGRLDTASQMLQDLRGFLAVVEEDSFRFLAPFVSAAHLQHPELIGFAMISPQVGLESGIRWLGDDGGKEKWERLESAWFEGPGSERPVFSADGRPVLFLLPVKRGEQSRGLALVMPLQGQQVPGAGMWGGVAMFLSLHELTNELTGGLPAASRDLSFALEDLGEDGGILLGGGMRPDQHTESTDFPVYGRVWRISSHADSTYLAGRGGHLPWLVLGTGLLLAFLLNFYLRGMNRARRENEALVAERTLDLQASELRNRVIVTEAADAVISIDREGRILSFNPAAERMFGYAESELLGLNVNTLMPEPYHSAHDGYMSRYQESGEPHIIGEGRDVVARRKDGSTFPVHLSVGEGLAGEEPIFIGVLRDLTYIKAAEQSAIREKEAAEEASRQKSIFLNMMSHELRTPLTVILGYLPILMDEKRMPDPATIAGIVSDMNVSGEHLLDLINDLLDISKIEAGQMELHLTDVDMHRLAADIVRKFSHRAEGQGVELHSKVEEIRLTVDERRVRQVLINLVGNALKFTQEGAVTIDGCMRDGRFCFEVSDTGPGIPGEQLQTIFEPFRQLDSSSTRKVGGTGLGLAISQRLVALHGGEIQVESTVGQGTTFRFTLNPALGG